ncbi:MAG: endonuclease/exonuclease/phosphatase family protein [Candidatus Competibacterales bacterium]|nr:endonuclease/exonuclease/phosphatase family protein [Candidatus Competibacterales bacterium]
MTELRVATYNIHQFRGMDRRTDRRRVLRVLERLDADLIGLQEVPRGQLGRVRLPGYHALPGPSLLWPGLASGTALLSRWPIASAHRHDLSVSGRERRGALDVSLALRHLRVRLITTHLGLRLHERTDQIERLLAILDHDEEADVLILCGDFNEWWPLRLLLGRLHRRLGHQPAPRSFPAPLPLLALDRIWAWGQGHRLRIRVRAQRRWPAPVASDHRPVLAEIGVEDD